MNKCAKVIFFENSLLLIKTIFFAKATHHANARCIFRDVIEYFDTRASSTLARNDTRTCPVSNVVLSSNQLTKLCATLSLFSFFSICAPLWRSRSNLRINIHTFIRRLMNIDAPDAYHVYTQKLKITAAEITRALKNRHVRHTEGAYRNGDRGKSASNPAYIPVRLLCVHTLLSLGGGGAPRRFTLFTPPLQPLKLHVARHGERRFIFRHRARVPVTPSSR